MASTFLSSLSPEQQQQLYDQAGFLLVRDFPQGSVAGIDGSLHQTLAFSGFKLIPPSLHLAVFAPPAGSSSSALPGPRTGLLFFSEPKQVLARSWSRDVDSLVTTSSGAQDVVSRDVLKSLDKELAPYPYDLWPSWKALFDGVTKEAIEVVLGPGGEGAGSWDLDGFKVGEEEELAGGADAGASLGAERVLRHRAEREGKPFLPGPSSAGTGSGTADGRRYRWAQFDLRRSWRADAVGEEVSLFARDKSWLLWDVVDSQCGGDPHRLLTQLSLLLPLAVLLQAPALLVNTYRRILSLLAQSHVHLDPLVVGQHLPPAVACSPERAVLLAEVYGALVGLLMAQTAWLPQDFFAVELPEAEGWFQTALLTDLADALARAEQSTPHLPASATVLWQDTRARYAALERQLKDKFGWERAVRARPARVIVEGWIGGDESEEEDEEDRPVFVENKDHYIL